MEPMSFPQKEGLPKLFAGDATTHNSRHELRKFGRVDVSAQHLIADLPQNRRHGCEITPDHYRIDGRIRPTCCVKTELICCGIYNPGNFRLSGTALALADQFFFARCRPD